MLTDNTAKNKSFRCIGIVGHPRHPEALATHELLYHWLLKKGLRVIVESDVAAEMRLTDAVTGTLPDIGQQADLVIVIGGDGNMLGAARVLSRYGADVIGVNRGNLGFLTDLAPDNALQQLDRVLTRNTTSKNGFCSMPGYSAPTANCAAAPRSMKWYSTPEKSPT